MVDVMDDDNDVCFKSGIFQVHITYRNHSFQVRDIEREPQEIKREIDCDQSWALSILGLLML